MSLNWVRRGYNEGLLAKRDPLGVEVDLVDEREEIEEVDFGLEVAPDLQRAILHLFVAHPHFLLFVLLRLVPVVVARQLLLLHQQPPVVRLHVVDRLYHLQLRQTLVRGRQALHSRAAPLHQVLEQLRVRVAEVDPVEREIVGQQGVDRNDVVYVFAALHLEHAVQFRLVPSS